ncbi:MAG: amylo-alpha-1,6-glucosidase [Bacteroides sp.]|nr:amylo-alpha-1,6-glucosidase [Bacteroides sp.]MDD2645815.1 amylo-alpha-1,6-glucosidase [Bacteroides sp.]MDD4054887.1 amylo-alpha-1,6-glucosidase [Bacteroides sp.]MDD4719831.1 amylo-alpha-1,6-glucosidase [Bacteroides sp.]NLI64528.1 4-alpha-glucanotransferase [Bacteroidales bacterium]
MSYLRFDKTLMINLEESLQREILRTNKSGAYHSTTIVDCNTRKYHGLLVIPIPTIDDNNHVLLSSLDETVIQHGAEFNLGLHKFEGNNWSPKGHKYIREFDCESIPATTYRVGGVILKKEKIFVNFENRILIKYTLLDAHSPTKLRFRPFLAFRSVHQLTYENGVANREYQEVENGIKTCMYEGYPELFMQLNKKNDFLYKPDWYKNVEYSKEQDRGLPYKEDLYTPGYFEVDIKKGESIVFSAGVSEASTRQLKRMFTSQVEQRTPRSSFYNCLKNSAHQLHNKQEGEHYILAGYPWFKSRARDTFISLPGLTLAVDEVDEYESAMKTATKALYRFMNGEPLDSRIKEIDHPDVLLWAVWALQQYAKEVSEEQCIEKYGGLIKDILCFIIEGKHPNITIAANGLLFSNGKDKAITWMNASNGDGPITPRTGYIVEHNALWHHALAFASHLFDKTDPELSNQLRERALSVKESFIAVFLNQHGYLYDFVDVDRVDWSVRPNMVIAAALDYSPLEKAQKKSIVDIATKELLTPKGLRSLSPKSVGYSPRYVGSQDERKYVYHQGTAWPWLMGFYMEAYLKLYKLSGLAFLERQLIGFDDEMTNTCVGSISELFDGNPPFRGRGAISFAMNNAEILRILKILSTYNQ